MVTLQNSQKEVERILSVMKQASFKLQLNSYKDNQYDEELMNSYLSYLAEDLNVANAMSIVF